MPRQYYHLTPEDRAHFLEHGWLRVPSSIKKKYIDEWLSDMWVRLGMDENDKSTWSTEYLKLPRHREEKAEEVCPEAWEKMCELVGGEEMVDPVRERHYGDQFIINFGTDCPIPRPLLVLGEVSGTRDFIAPAVAEKLYDLITRSVVGRVRLKIGAGLVDRGRERSSCHDS